MINLWSSVLFVLVTGNLFCDATKNSARFTQNVSANSSANSTQPNMLTDWWLAPKIISFKRRINTVIFPFANTTQLESDWFRLNGPGYALKLLQLVSKEKVNPNQVFSPLALKLSLLAMSSLSSSMSQEAAISKFLFDYTKLPQSYQSREFSFNMDKLSYLDLNQIDSVLSPRKVLDEIEARSDEKPTLWRRVWNLVTWSYDWVAWLWNVKYLMRNKNAKTYLQAPIHQADTNGMCYLFRDNHLQDCIDNMVLSQRYDAQKTASELSQSQKIRLCLEFGVKNYFECIHTFALEPKDYPKEYNRHADYTTAEVAKKLVNEFCPKSLSKEEKISNRRILFLNSTNFDMAKDYNLWDAAMDWFGMESYDLSKEIEQWRVLIKQNSTNQMIRDNELLNTIQFEHKFVHSFSPIGKQNFYLNKTTQKVETLNSQNFYGLVYHNQSSSLRHTLVNIPYNDTRYSLVLMLPDRSSSIQGMLNSLSAVQLNHYFKLLQLEPVSLNLTMPKLTISGQMDFGPILRKHNIQQFRLNRIDPKLSIPSNLRQFILGKNVYDVQSFQKIENFDSKTTKNSAVVTFNRPFVYMIVGKYINLHQKPGFEILLTGFYCGLRK